MQNVTSQSVTSVQGNLDVQSIYAQSLDSQGGKKTNKKNPYKSRYERKVLQMTQCTV